MSTSLETQSAPPATTVREKIPSWKWAVVWTMFLATISKPKQLLHLGFIERVTTEELAQARENLVTLLGDLMPGFRLLSDMDRLASIVQG